MNGSEEPLTNNDPNDPIKDSKEYKDLEAVFTRAARWVQFGIVCGIVGGITGVTALLIVILQ